uniref:Uncharacterized protein n=1 Tax=Wuchereria bancrofti TaxID=6293 RepID=A0AAF5PR85_WUCBA
MSTVRTTDEALSGESKTSETSSLSSFKIQSNPVTDATQTSTQVTSLEPASNEVHEFDVDLLYSWDQSSGTLSYEAWSPSLIDTFDNAKMPPKCNDIICRAKLNQRLLHDSMPSQKLLSAKSLVILNEEMRRKRMHGHLLKRIVVPCKQNENMERYELISKICDDAISEYMASNNHQNKMLKINLECGGDMPPRVKVNGIRAERPINYDQDYYDTSKTVQINQFLRVCNANHSFRHLSTCSPALPYPSANTFSRCSIEDYVKKLKERRQIQKKQ